MNLDPWAENYVEQVKALSEYKLGDKWYFTLSLPKIFGASNVYQNYDLISRHGEIKDYDFIDYTDTYNTRTDKFSAETDRTVINLKFDTTREHMSHIFISWKCITVHYQSAGGAYSGISECPLIGTESAVTGITENSQNLLIAFAILSAFVFAVFVVLAVLERSYDFVSSIIWTFGIFIMLLSRFFLSGVTTVPLMWTAFSLASSFVVLGGALLSIGRNIGKIPAQFVCPAFMGVGAVLAAIRPFVSFGAASALTAACTAIKAIGVILLTAFIGLETFRKKHGDNYGVLRTVCAALIDVAITASLFLPQVFPARYNSMLWMCVATAAVTFVSVFVIFWDIKKSNAYLTANLHKEVERQVKDIKAVISERDRLLQFVSHDMKKPLLSSSSLLETLIQREKDGEQAKGLTIVKQNTARVVNNLSQIAVYAKFNYIAEPSQVVDVSDLCDDLYDFHTPDCNANGIVLKNLVAKSVKAFVKRQGLESVLSNLIINAVEHANCTTITLSVKTDKDKAILCVADNGKGIDGDIDVFSPYVSENGNETGGVGLYICKSVVESMNGELYYESNRNGTVFYVALLKA